MQGTLTAESAKVRNDAKETARLAALRAAPSAGTKRFKILHAFLTKAALKHGLTDDEIAIKTIIPPNTVRPRRIELVEGGWVVDSGKRRVNTYGNQCIVWIYNSANES